MCSIARKICDVFRKKACVSHVCSICLYYIFVCVILCKFILKCSFNFFFFRCPLFVHSYAYISHVYLLLVALLQNMCFCYGANTGLDWMRSGRNLIRRVNGQAPRICPNALESKNGCTFFVVCVCTVHWIQKCTLFFICCPVPKCIVYRIRVFLLLCAMSCRAENQQLEHFEHTHTHTNDEKNAMLSYLWEIKRFLKGPQHTLIVGRFGIFGYIVLWEISWFIHIGMLFFVDGVLRE